MEIHTPDKPIHTKKDFVVHMLTVVLGILIALGLDGVVTWLHHRSLVREARANISAELRQNKEAIRKALPEIQKAEEQLQKIISAMDKVASTHKLDEHSLPYSFVVYELYSTAWKTASVSGAVTYMDYDELKAYTDAYDLQQSFLALQSQKLSSVGELNAATRILNTDLSKVPVARFEAIQQEAIKLLTTEQALENIARALPSEYDLAKGH